jgi:hypothetical protein
MSEDSEDSIVEDVTNTNTPNRNTEESTAENNTVSLMDKKNMLMEVRKEQDSTKKSSH